MEAKCNFIVLGNSFAHTKEEYHSPEVEIIEIKIEKGFAASSTGDGSGGTGDWGTGTW